MAKILVIRKPIDKTIHKVSLANEAILRAFSNRLPIGQRWSFETMDEESAAKLQFIDKDFVTAGEAVQKVKSLEDGMAAKDNRIAELEALLAAKTGGAADTGDAGNSTVTKAADVIEKINAATSAEEVDTIVGTDNRSTVTKAADAKKATFTA